MLHALQFQLRVIQRFFQTLDDLQLRSVLSFIFFVPALSFTLGSFDSPLRLRQLPSQVCFGIEAPLNFFMKRLDNFP